MIVHTGFLVLTGRTILEFVGLLELKVRTILLEYTEGVGLRTSTGRTGRTSVLKLRGPTGFLVSTGGTILEFTYLLALIEHTIFVSSLTVIKQFIL